MKIEYWTESEINEDGTMGDPVQPERGSVNTVPRMDTSGMHHLQTHSTKRDGLWLMVTTGRLPDGTMHGITIYFRDEDEMTAFERTRTAGIEHRRNDDPPDETSGADYWKS
jgi:hypothetical protein